MRTEREIREGLGDAIRKSRNAKKAFNDEENPAIATKYMREYGGFLQTIKILNWVLEE